MSESGVEFLNVQADSEFDPGDRVQIVGLDGIVRPLRYTVIGPGDHRNSYTLLRNDFGGEVAVHTGYLRRVGEVRSE